LFQDKRWLFRSWSKVAVGLQPSFAKRLREDAGPGDLREHN
jgi:hypothetical protein